MGSEPESESSVPEWASFFEEDDYDTFAAGVTVDLNRRGAAHELGDDGVVCVGEERYGLLNIAQACHQAPREKWAAMLEAHFDNLFQIRAATEAGRVAESYAAAEHSLRVRLMAPDAAKQIRGLAREVATGLFAVLVRDLPSVVQTVSEEEIRAWAQPADVLFARGLAQLEPIPTPKTLQAAGGASIDLYLGDHFFVASHALRLGALVDSAPHGAVIGIPHRHALLVHVIEDLRVLPVINTMVMLANKLFDEGPGSLTPNLYWWKDGQLTHLPAKLEGKQLELKPPEAFVEMMNALPRPPSK